MLRRRDLFPRYTVPPPTKIIFTLRFQVLSVSCGWRWELSPLLFCLFFLKGKYSRSVIKPSSSAPFVCSSFPSYAR